MISQVLVQDGRVAVEHDAAANIPWWSFTKSVIAAASLVLVSKNKLELDEGVDGQPFTLRQLLTHQAGLTDYYCLSAYQNAVASGDEPWSEEEIIERTDAGRLRYTPGENWSYSNIGYLYVRRLIETATSENLGDALKRLVLGPLGIDHTYMASSSADLKGVRTDQQYDPRWVYHGLLVGPLLDAAYLLERLITKNLLPTALLDAMLDWHELDVPTEDRPWTSPRYGLGLMGGTVAAGTTCIGHTGEGPGSVIAVYHALGSTPQSTAAAFAPDGTQGLAEQEVVRLLA